LVNNDPKKVKWTSSLISDLCRGKVGQFSSSNIAEALYRPFSKFWLYYDPQFNHRYKEKLYPSSKYSNISIQVTGSGSSKEFSALLVDTLPDLEVISKGQCFPLRWYEKAKKGQQQTDSQMGFAFQEAQEPDENGFIRRDGVTDKALANFRKHYADDSISKEDIFFYVYGVLHSPEYRQRFAADLKRMLPRIPFTKDFHAFSAAGRKLGDLHVNYESVEPYPLEEEKKSLDLDHETFYRVHKMVFGKKDGKKDKSVIVYNGNLSLSGIPDDAYRYVVNGKPAIEWLMERYAVTVDKDTGIRNDPNEWSDDPRYIVDLIKRVVQVSVETVAIVKSLPALNEKTFH
jgi:predicted helicase